VNPDDIRRLYDQSRTATPSEAAATQEQLRTDPELARRMYVTVLALASTDPAFRALANAVARPRPARACTLACALASA
jgi:hypothetical protein